MIGKSIPDLSLNLGLRYTLNWPSTEANDRARYSISRHNAWIFWVRAPIRAMLVISRSSTSVRESALPTELPTPLSFAPATA